VAVHRDCDLAVVGGGIVGLAVARELANRHPDAEVRVLERETKLAAHQTGHSSGVIHAGIYYRPGSLKARLCVEGARDLYAYCEERGIETRRHGKLIVAADAEELTRLDELERRGRENGVSGLRRLAGNEIPEVEPHAVGEAALHSPDTGVVDFVEVAEALASDLVAADGSIVRGAEVRDLTVAGDRIELKHAGGTTRARFAVVCAGAWADRLAVRAGAPAEPRIVPFRGAYLKLRPESRSLVRASVYPAPNPELPFLGAHATRTIGGEVLLGPSALMVGARDGYRLWRVRPGDVASTVTWPGTARLIGRHWRTALAEVGKAASRGSFVRDLQRYLPGLRASDTLPGPSGVRAQALGRDGSLIDDFVLHRTDRAVHVRNAPSPAATSALALARLIADEVELG